MKNKFITSLVAIAAIIGFTATVRATPITGSIQIGGDVHFDTSSLFTATSATFAGSPDGTVTSGTAAYSAAGVAGSPVEFSDFTFAASGPQVRNPLWTFLDTVNGWTYSFNLSSITDIVRAHLNNGSDTLSIAGLGSVTITGIGSTFDETFANWSFNVTDSSGGTSGSFKFSFNDSNTATPRVPDGGTTVVLLGAALSGLAWVNARRKQ